MFTEDFRLQHTLRWAMVGGGRGSQIGYIHRCASQRDMLFKLVAGAFDIDEQRGRDFGMSWGVDADRCYANYKIMFEEEAKREDGIEVVSIATPNATHYEICKAAINAGLHVVCEKPLCFTTEQAEELNALAVEKNRVVGMTYGYTGAQMIHQAREMIAHGELGKIRIINMQFAHGYHSEAVEANDPGTKWRVTPASAGPTYVLGDVGTHALFLAEAMIPELEIKKLLCTRQSFVASRAPLEDNATVLMEFEGGAVGTLWASCVNAGSVHQLKIRVVGEKGSIEWHDEFPNQIRFEPLHGAAKILDRGQGYLYSDNEMIANDRLGGGHAEGLFEAWANLYRQFGRAMERATNGEKVADINKEIWYPNIIDGGKGVEFIEKCVESADNGSIWVEL